GGVRTVVEWKSGKAIYPEAFLQNVAYRHAAARLGLPAEQGLIVRLPKLLDDPAWEVMPVPEELQIEDFQAALALWRWQRQMVGQPTGHPPTDPPCRSMSGAATVGSVLMNRSAGPRREWGRRRTGPPARGGGPASGGDVSARS